MDNFTDTDRADLKAAKDGFLKMMNGLTPDQQLARAEVIAGGIREADPLTRAMAKQMVEANRLNGRVEAFKKEIVSIDAMDLNAYRPRDPDFKGRMLARRRDAEQQLQQDVARIVALHEEGLGSAQLKAVAHFRDLRRHNDRQTRIAEAIARKQAERDQAEIDAIADGIVNGGRFKIGKSGSAGHSQ